MCSKKTRKRMTSVTVMTMIYSQRLMEVTLWRTLRLLAALNPNLKSRKRRRWTQSQRSETTWSENWDSKGSTRLIRFYETLGTTFCMKKRLLSWSKSLSFAWPSKKCLNIETSLACLSSMTCKSRRKVEVRRPWNKPVRLWKESRPWLQPLAMLHYTNADHQ